MQECVESRDDALRDCRGLCETAHIVSGGDDQAAARCNQLFAARCIIEIRTNEPFRLPAPVHAKSCFLACRFSAHVQTPHLFSKVRKIWRYCRLGSATAAATVNSSAARSLTLLGVGSSRI